MLRLPHFLDHYRKLGVGHFFFVDNASNDGTTEYLADQPDVSLWLTAHSYKLSRFGMDWLGWLQWRFGHGHWCLTVDADELLVLPNDTDKNLVDLTAWLDETGKKAFGALMLDMYPKTRISEANYESGDDPITVLNWFDADNYRHIRHPIYDNDWIQGGVRERVFFSKDPRRSPTLSKTPLVKWHWRYAYVSSTHQLLPRKLNRVFDLEHHSLPTGVLMHTKFLPDIMQKSSEEIGRRQHFENSELYQDYHQALENGPCLWDESSHEFENWEQLVALKLMSKGDWV